MQTSESIKSIALALSKAQAELKPALKDSKNPFFKSNYADLESSWAACRECLAKNELALTQIVDHDIANQEVVHMVHTMLLHSSGEYIRGTSVVPVQKNTSQDLGSGIKYMRRYALQSIIGIADSDDDGEAAMGRKGVMSKPTTAKMNHPDDKESYPKQDLSKGPSEKQLKRLSAISIKAKWPRITVQNYSNRTYQKPVRELVQADYNALCEFIEKNVFSETIEKVYGGDNVTN